MIKITRTTNSSNRRRVGHSLLELVAASTLIATTLVPALRIMASSLKVSRMLTTSEAMATLCASTLERALAHTSANWSTTSSAGNFSADGYSAIGYSIMRSDSKTDGGIPNSLMTVQVTTWDDRNNNGLLDTGEPTVVYASKVARLTTYGYEAKNS